VSSSKWKQKKGGDDTTFSIELWGGRGERWRKGPFAHYYIYKQKKTFGKDGVSGVMAGKGGGTKESVNFPGLVPGKASREKRNGKLKVRSVCTCGHKK